MSKRRRDESSAAPGAGVVRLNVGGTIYTTTLDTLRAVPDSLFGRMFDPDISLGMVPTDEDGNIFFDRDPEVFRWVLDFLRRRGRSVGMPRRELRPLLRDEADYFGLVKLVKACDKAMHPEDDLSVQRVLMHLAKRISDDPKTSVMKAVSELSSSIDGLDCSSIDYSEELGQISAHLQHIGAHIYDVHGSDDLYSAIRGE